MCWAWEKEKSTRRKRSGGCAFSPAAMRSQWRTPLFPMHDQYRTGDEPNADQRASEPVARPARGRGVHETIVERARADQSARRGATAASSSQALIITTARSGT